MSGAALSAAIKKGKEVHESDGFKKAMAQAKVAAEKAKKGAKQVEKSDEFKLLKKRGKQAAKKAGKAVDQAKKSDTGKQLMKDGKALADKAKASEAGQAAVKHAPALKAAFLRAVPVEAVAFLKAPSVEAIEANPALLLSVFSLLSMVANPLRIPMAMLLNGGAQYIYDEAKKSPKAVRAVEEAKAKALEQALAQASAGTVMSGLEVPPDVMHQVAKRVDTRQVVKLAPTVSPGDMASLAKMAK